MKQILAFVSHKGGVGKTTCTLQIAAALAQRYQQRVLAIDLDGQGNLTRGLLREQIPATMTASHLLLNLRDPVSGYIINARPQLDLLPNRYVAEQDLELARMMADWQNLRARLRPVEPFYDYILLDTPSAMLHATRSAIVAADQVMLVMSCGQFSLTGATNTFSQVMELQQQSRRAHIPLKVIVNLFDERRGLDQRILADLQRIFDGDLCRTRIRQNIRLGEAAQASETIFERDSHSLGAQDFDCLTRELLGLPPEDLFRMASAKISARPLISRPLSTIIIPIPSHEY